MRRRMFHTKIHRATVTHANVAYEGSVTIDADLLDAAGMFEHEEVHVWNVTRGTRLTTYTLRGEPGSGVICINGAAAHLNEPGDLVILACYADMEEEEARSFVPTVVRVDEQNRLVEIRGEDAGPKMPRLVNRSA